jgi:hypothetical protein
MKTGTATRSDFNNQRDILVGRPTRSAPVFASPGSDGALEVAHYLAGAVSSVFDGAPARR